MTPTLHHPEVVPNLLMVTVPRHHQVLKPIEKKVKAPPIKKTTWPQLHNSLKNGAPTPENNGTTRTPIGTRNPEPANGHPIQIPQNGTAKPKPVMSIHCLTDKKESDAIARRH